MTQKAINETEWIPQKKVGPFKFGHSIKEYIQKYNLVSIPEEYNEKASWSVYKVGEDDRIYVEEDKIVSILCCSKCLYKDRNLIGMSIDEVSILLGSKPDEKDMVELSNGLQEVYEYDQFGLQLWVMNGNVITAIIDDSM
jgi:hypothetical protein